MARRTRTAEQRGLRTRAASTREIPTGEYQGDLYIPPQVRRRFEDSGYKLSWIRRSVRNQEDGLNIRQRTIGGWKPVDATQAPELVAPDWFGEEGGPTKKFVEVGGLILCQCPIDLNTAAARRPRKPKPWPRSTSASSRRTRAPRPSR